MKSLIAVAGLALSMGCASLGSMPDESSSPLRAYLLPHSSSSGDVSFHVSRPAHVAVFRIVPGQGTSMVYPYGGISSDNSRVYSGFHSLGFGRRRDDFVFTGFGSGARFGPEFYFMIASEKPLRLEQFGDFGSGLERAMGTSVAFSGAQLTMERLVSLAVPDLADESWTTDYYVHWPETQGFSQRNFVQISCNGMVINVPVESAAWAADQLCRRSQTEPSEPPVVETPRDSVVEPRRRDPVEPTDRISSIQLTDPEAWERLRGLAEEAAATPDLRSRDPFNSEEVEPRDAGLESLRRTRPMRQSDASSSDNGQAGRSRPSPESASRPETPSSAERERPTPSDGDSGARPLAPPQPE